MSEGIKQWIRAAAVRAIKTAAQSAIAAIGATTTMGGVDWAVVGSTALLAAIVSVLTSLAGIPKAGGENVVKLAKASVDDEGESA